MLIGPEKLMESIREFDSYLTRDIAITAVGGTALTLLGKKESTKDIDLCFKTEADQDRFLKIAERLGYKLQSGRLVGHGLIIDLFTGGYIFCVQLPSDYQKKATEIRKMRRIHLFSLAPLDLIITKTARLNERDLEDIETIFMSFDINKDELVTRYFATMEGSVVRDAKLNLKHLAYKFNFSATIKKRIEKWDYD